MMRKVFVLLTILFLLAACGPGEPTATPTPSATDTPVPTPTPEAFISPDLPVIDADNVAELTVFQEYPDHVGVAFSPDGGMMVLQGSTLMTVNLESGETTEIIDLPGQNYHTAISDDGRFIGYQAENDDGQSVTRIWDLEAGEVAAEGPLARYGLVFIPGTSILALADNNLPFIDAATGEPVEHTIEGRSTPYKIGVTPDGEYLITESIGHLAFDSTTTYEEARVWDFTTEIDGTTVAPAMDAFAVSADGQLVAVGFNTREERAQLRTIQIWDTETDEAVHVIPFELVQEASGAGVKSAAFSPDGGLLAVGFDDWNFSGHVDVYDVESGEKIAELEAPNGVYQLAFSPDGRLLAVGTTQRDGLTVYAAGM